MKWRPRLSAFLRKMSPMPAPQTTTISSPASSAIPLSPAGDISREEPIAKRSPAIRNVSPAFTRARNSGMRWRKAPAFQRSSNVARLSETQSDAGVIWSVSIASSFFPGRLGSQKMRARPRMGLIDVILSPRAGACQLSGGPKLVEGSFEGAQHHIHRLPLEGFADRRFGSGGLDRKSTRLNSSHVSISYAVFCLKKKKE